MPSPTILDRVASDLALWLDQESTRIAAAMAPQGSAPFSAQLSEQQKLQYYRDQLFNPDGTPNLQGRNQQMQRLGPQGFTQVYKAVLKAYPALKLPTPPGMVQPPVTQAPGAPPSSPVPAPYLPRGAQTATMPNITPIVPMAGGGIVTQPTLALIGEAGPEAVVPLADYQYQQPNYFTGDQAAPQRPPVTMWDDVIRPHAGEYADDPRFLRTVAAAAQAESTNDPRAYQLGYDPNDPRTYQKYGGRGLWQFDIGPQGMGHGIPEEQLFDPNYQASQIVPQFAANYARLQRQPGITDEQLAAQVYAAAERPAGTYGGKWTSPNADAYANYIRAFNNLALPPSRR
jgi:hypothetical protein